VGGVFEGEVGGKWGVLCLRVEGWGWVIGRWGGGEKQIEDR
jgi:hypothetical protein